MNIKVYVDVTARFNSEGVLIPLSLTWRMVKNLKLTVLLTFGRQPR